MLEGKISMLLFCCSCFHQKIKINKALFCVGLERKKGGREGERKKKTGRIQKITENIIRGRKMLKKEPSSLGVP